MKVNKMYDAIIIGAGPAGSAAAKALADNGCKVLILEKFKLPRYKACSGVLIKKSMSLVKEYFGIEVPLSAMCTPTENRGMIFTTDKGKEYRFEQEGLNVWRSSFDNLLAQSAVESGTELRDGAAVTDCKNTGDCVSVVFRRDGKEYTESARYVINCEGVVGSVKRKLTGSPGQYITTYQTFNKGSVDLDPHYFYAYLQPELSEYDAWLNVKDGLIVLGVSVKNASRIPSLYTRFTEYMREKHGLVVDEQIREEKWLMPHIQPGCHISFGTGRVLFAGECAGFLNPMGEGISAALESGTAAALAVSRFFGSTEKIYGEYERETASLREYMRRQWSFTGSMAETFAVMR